MLQAVRRCRRWASAPGAASLVFFIKSQHNMLPSITLSEKDTDHIAMAVYGVQEKTNARTWIRDILSAFIMLLFAKNDFFSVISLLKEFSAGPEKCPVIFVISALRLDIYLLLSLFNFGWKENREWDRLYIPCFTLPPLKVYVTPWQKLTGFVPNRPKIIHLYALNHYRSPKKVPRLVFRFMG